MTAHATNASNQRTAIVPRHPSMKHSVIGTVAVAAALMAISARPAFADFRLCDNTGGRVGVAIGYKDADGWTTEGWWNISARSCDTLLRGALVARYYYIYAVDYDRGGEWSDRKSTRLNSSHL